MDIEEIKHPRALAIQFNEDVQCKACSLLDRMVGVPLQDETIEKVKKYASEPPNHSFNRGCQLRFKHGFVSLEAFYRRVGDEEVDLQTPFPQC